MDDVVGNEEWYPWKVDGWRVSLHQAFGAQFWCSHGHEGGVLIRVFYGFRCDTCGRVAPEELRRMIGYVKGLEDM